MLSFISGRNVGKVRCHLLRVWILTWILRMMRANLLGFKKILKNTADAELSIIPEVSVAVPVGAGVKLEDRLRGWRGCMYRRRWSGRLRRGGSRWHGFGCFQRMGCP